MRIRYPSALAAPLILLLLGALAPPASAALKKITFDELTRQSDRVVHGKVTALRSYYDTWSTEDDEIIVTEITLLPISLLKGEAPRPVVFVVPGGKIGDISCVVSEAPVFRKGEEVVVFLSRQRDMQREFVWAHWHGKYEVVPRGRSRELTVRGLPGAPVRKSVKLSELARRVREVEPSRNEKEGR